jgi:putative DNA primase/helicase
LTVGVSPQPDVLETLKDKPGFRGRGLLARFLYGLPKSPLGHRTLEPRPVPTEVERQYRSGIHRLIAFDPQNRTEKLLLNESAYDEWKDFQRAVEVQFRDGGRLQYLKDWGSKLPGAAIRLAGVFHIVEQEGRRDLDRCIPKSTIQQAVDLAACLISHAQCVFALMERDPAIDSAEKLLAWAIGRGQPSFTVRDCFRAHQGRFKRVDAMLPILSLLEQHGYIRRVPQGSAGGRKPSETCEVNPAVLTREPR